MIKKRIAVILAALVTLTLAGCGDDIPSEALAKKTLEDKYASSPYLKMDSFKKVNGRQSSFGGESAYIIYYEAEVEAKKPFNALYDEATKKFVDFGEGTPTTKQLSMKAGDKVVTTGKIDFVKTENGWQKE